MCHFQFLVSAGQNPNLILTLCLIQIQIEIKLWNKYIFKYKLKYREPLYLEISILDNCLTIVCLAPSRALLLLLPPLTYNNIWSPVAIFGPLSQQNVNSVQIYPLKIAWVPKSTDYTQGNQGCVMQQDILIYCLGSFHIPLSSFYAWQLKKWPRVVFVFHCIWRKNQLGGSWHRREDVVITVNMARGHL